MSVFLNINTVAKQFKAKHIVSVIFLISVALKEMVIHLLSKSSPKATFKAHEGQESAQEHLAWICQSHLTS